MRALLDRVGVRRCTDVEGAPEPTQCGSGVAAACGCGERPPCFFTITQLAETAGRRGPPPSMRAAAAGASATACAVHCLARTRARHGERRAHELRRAEPAAAEPGGADESLVRCCCHTQPHRVLRALGSPTSGAVPVAACKCARTRGGSSPRNRRRCWPRSRERRAASVHTCDHGCGTAWLAPHRGSCPRAAWTGILARVRVRVSVS